MLGMGRASQYAGWWNTGGPPVVNFSATGQLSYQNYQTPVFSYINSSGTSDFNFRTSSNDTEYIDTTNYTSNTDYNTYRFTHVLPFKLTLPAGLQQFDGIVYTPRINNGSAGSPNYGTISWSINDSGNLTVAFYGPFVSLPGAYADYDDRWLFLVVSSAETSGAYTDWNSVGGNGPNYTRIAVFDEFGELIVKADERRTSSNDGVVDITTWLNGAAGTVYTDDNKNYMYNFNPITNTPPAGMTITHSGYWYCWGTMFDPLTTTDTSWRTTRPSSTIGTAVAWQNIQFTDYLNPSTGNYYVEDQGDDILVATSDRNGRLMINGNATVFGDRYSTTDFPRDKG